MRSIAVVAAVAVPLAIIIVVLSLPDPRDQNAEGRGAEPEQAEAQSTPYEPDPQLMGRRSYGPIHPQTGEDVPLSVAELAAGADPEMRVGSMQSADFSQARMWLPRVQGGINSPVEPILAQMPADPAPEQRQEGDRRIFTYTFPDDSQAILTFRPGGFGDREPILYAANVIEDGPAAVAWDAAMGVRRRAIEAAASARETSSADDDAGQSQARAYLSRIRGDIGSPMESILSQMPDDIIPSRRQSGEQRIFTYEFDDGSQMILTFRPREAGRGLILYTVDVRDLGGRWSR